MYTVGGNVIGIVTMENNMEVLRAIKFRITIWSSNSNSKYIPKKWNQCLKELSVPPCFLQHYLQHPRLGNNLSTDEWIKKMWYICERVCMCMSSAIKKKKILTFVAAGVDLYGIVPSERSQTEKNKYCMILLIYRT